MISFIIYFHSSRLNNLEQTLRLLTKRERKLDKELILVCQDECYINVPFGFNKVKQINLLLPDYHKSKMCNVGVKLASSEIIVILDSDRILPYDYFTRNTISLQQSQIISTIPLYRLKTEYSDEEIESGNIEKEEDFRSEHNVFMKKNLFSGNTIMYKSDYLSCGGMDESFIGYGYTDNDMTANVLSKHMLPIYLQEEELHLYHDNVVSYNGEMLELENWITYCMDNKIKYMKKWGLFISMS